MTNFSETISVLEKKALSERMRQLKANIEREVGRLCGRECWEKS
jgi:hypothetical protein